MTAYERKDHYHRQAKLEGFRSRAAYKLEELQRSHRLLRAGQRIVDLGCWPGGWLQVASRIAGPAGRVVGVDLARIEPPLDLANVIALVGDVTDPALPERVLEALGRPADAILSDAAPKLTGARATDRAREGALLEALEGLVPALLRPGGSLLLKLLDCPEAAEVARRLGTRFERAGTTRPRATRKGSRERYLRASGFRPG